MPLDSALSAITRVDPAYPQLPPYHPGELYPEYPFRHRPECLSSEPNAAYLGVREAFRLLGFDAPHFGTADWNPLGHLIKPGMTVLLKPNYVRDFHEITGQWCPSLITHGSIIRAVADYAIIALHRQGRLIIADSSHGDAHFEDILRLTGIPALQELLHQHTNVQLEVYDLRQTFVHKVDGVLVDYVNLPGDPLGYSTVDLGRDSALEPVAHKFQKFYGAGYDRLEIQQHHKPGVHEYPLCRTILDADVILNVPKMKTHKKCGVTLSLKNLIGINGNKNWLPHHTEGVPAEGGDQFDRSDSKNRIERRVVEAFKAIFPKLGPLRHLIAAPAKGLGKKVFGDTNRDKVRSGNWWGNDTVWRTCVDLMRILIYCDKKGVMQDTPQRAYLSLIDGLIGGEGNGPLAPDDRPTGLIVASENPVFADAVATRLMGFDHRHIPIIARAFEPMRWPLAFQTWEAGTCVSNQPNLAGPASQLPTDQFPYQPHFGWEGHIRPGDPVEPSPVTA
jgi:uncharacterized protein (DUF362 family)